MSNSSELKPIKNQPLIFSRYNRFNRHPVYIDPTTGNKFLGAWDPPTFPIKDTDKTYQVSVGLAYRPDSIAYKHYDTPLLAWVICYVNNIMNPWDKNTGLYPGRIIRIPDITTVTVVTSF